MTTAITDHEVQAVNRLRQVLRDQTTVPAFIQAFANPANALDAALMQLFLERSIDTSIGAQLDDIGALVGLPRESIDSSLVDDDYRRYVRAKIWSLKSSGTVEDILRVLSQVIYDPTALIAIEEQFPAGIQVTVSGIDVTSAIHSIATFFLQLAKALGIRAIFVSSSDEANAFTFATAFTQLNGLHGAGSTTLTVDDTSEFPASGTLTLDAALAVEEDVTYTGKTATTFTGVSSTSNAHSDNAAVQLATDPGLGFEDEASPGVGGKFSAASE